MVVVNRIFCRITSLQLCLHSYCHWFDLVIYIGSDYSDHSHNVTIYPNDFFLLMCLKRMHFDEIPKN